MSEDADVRSLAVHELDVLGLEVELCERASAALERFAAAPRELILLDLDTRGVDAARFCLDLAGLPSGPAAAVVLLAPADCGLGLERGLAAGASDFVTKPADPVRLRRRLGCVLRAESALTTLRRREAQLVAAQEMATLGSWSLDAETWTVFGSEEFRRLYELPATPRGWALSLWLSKLPSDDRARFERELRLGLGRGAAVCLDHGLDDGSGRSIRVEARPGDGGRGVQLEGTAQDVTELRRGRTRLTDLLAFHDPLTGLGNQRLFRHRLERVTEAARRHGRIFGMLSVNLDHFNQINSDFGHEAGDLVLRVAASRLLSSVRSYDLVAKRDSEEPSSEVSRLGGDAFVIVLDEIATPWNAARVARRILDHLARPVRLGGRSVSLGASIGIAVYPDDALDADALVQRADLALANAKGAGRGEYQFHSAAMNAEAARRITLELGLRRALRGGRLQLAYQPRVDLRTGEVGSVEALCRWPDPVLGSVPPGVFIPLAESCGLIAELGTWVLRTACEQLARWHEAGRVGLSVSVNLAAAQVGDPGLPQIVRAALDETELPAKSLEVEITETALIQNEEVAARNLQALVDMGVRVALDDFGSGYSSLIYLRRFPVHTIKIDRSFTAGVIDCPDDAAIVQAMISMAQALRLRTVAEGVETEEQREFVARAGCDEEQGYRYSPPLPPEGLETLLDGARER